MKLLMVSAAIILAPGVQCQDNKPDPERLHFTVGMPGTGGGRVILTASTMQRDLTSRATESVMQLKGAVELRMITCIPAGPGDAYSRCEGAMVLRADEVDYNEKTGEIDARGNVHIAPHQAAPAR